MHSLVAAGSIEVPETNVPSLASQIDEICSRAGFPERDEFKWSPGAELWMRNHLVGDARREFYLNVLNAAQHADIRAMVVIEDAAYAPATGNCSAETDVTRMLLERVHLTIPVGEYGIFIADRPGGGRGDEDRFVADCLETLRSGTNIVRNLCRLALALTTPSKFSRLLQLADVITGCTTAFVSGEANYSPAVFGGIRPILRSERERIGGVGVKIHPDAKYLNLYHWLFGDEYFWRFNVGTPLPFKHNPYPTSADLYK